MSSFAINTNTTATAALRNLQSVDSQLATSVQRLSSGLRINAGADDPAGLIISTGMAAQVASMNQASTNAQEANSLLKTAEGGLSEVATLLRSVRTLAVHAANTGANDATAAQADQTQIQSALASINRIATQTKFGTKDLLDGAAGVSANVVDSADAAGIYIGGNFDGYATQAGAVSVAVTQAAQRASMTVGNFTASFSLINTNYHFVINGQTIDVTPADTLQAWMNKVNDYSATTHVSAAMSGASVVLTQTLYGAGNGIDYSVYNYGGGGGASQMSAAGTSAVATVTAMVYKDGVVQAQSTTFTGATTSGGNGLQLQDQYGNNILLTEQGAANTTATGVAIVNGANLTFQIGANAGQQADTSLMNAQTSQLGASVVAGKSLADVDVTSAAGAADALKILDQAISQVSQQRATIGAFQTNTLDSAVRYLGVGAQNLSSSESQLQDTDVAAEIVKMTRSQILSQAGTSVLKTANQLPQMALSLLQ